MWPFSPRAATYDQVESLHSLIERMARLMARSFEEVLHDLDDLTTSAADRISAQNAIISQLEEAVAAGDTRLVEALAQQASEHVDAMEQVADRLRDVAVDEEDVVPDTSPLPEIPEPVTEAPAEAPATVDETGTPEAR